MVLCSTIYKLYFSGYDECGLYNIPIVENDQEDTHLIEHSLDSVGVEQQIEDANTIEHSLDPVGLEQQIKDLKYKEFSTFDTRLQSFSNCEVYLKKMIVYLCEAGIFYTSTVLLWLKYMQIYIYIFYFRESPKLYIEMFLLWSTF